MALPDPQRARRRMQDAVAHAAGAPDADEAAARLTPLFADTDWLEALTEQLIAPMRAQNGPAPSLPAARNGPSLTVTLASAPPVRLMLHLIEGAAERPDSEDATPDGAPTIGFSGTHGFYRLLSAHPVDSLFGTIPPGGARCRTRPMTLRPGQWLALDESRRALRIQPQTRPILLLRARIEHIPAPPIRHYAIADGKLVSTVQGDEGFARSAMLLSVLRELGARDAVPAMIALLDRFAGRERWTVMRELLALDASAAWPHLVAMAANDPDPAVRAAAQAVLARHSSIPQPKAEPEPCPA